MELLVTAICYIINPRESLCYLEVRHFLTMETSFQLTLRISLLAYAISFKILQSTILVKRDLHPYDIFAGTRTRKLWIRSPARYPLRHGVCCEEVFGIDV